MCLDYCQTALHAYIESIPVLHVIFNSLGGCGLTYVLVFCKLFIRMVLILC